MRTGARPRVLIVSPQPFYEDRGTPIAVSQLAAALIALGYDVDLLSYPIGVPVHLPGLELLTGHNPFGFLHVRIGFSLRKLVLDAGLLGPLLSLLRSRSYDAVHVLEEMAWPVVFLCRRRGIPVVYDMQSSLPDQLRSHRVFRPHWVRRILHRCEDWVLRRADAIICAAGLLAHVKSRVPDATAYEWKWPGHTPGSPDSGADLRARLGIGPGRRIVLYAGTFEPYQGIDLLLGALERAAEEFPGIVGVLIGATPERDMSDDPQAARLAAAGLLHILPRQPREVIAEYLAIADVLVSPRAYGDNVPLKIFDYVMSGRPIVATDIAAHGCILDGQTARLVGRSPEAIAEGIVALLRDPEQGARLAAAAMKKASAAPGKQAYIDLVESLYASTIRPEAVASRARRKRPR
jgi:glycosyltransferase involved in cell wall biosynthesis